MSVLGSKKEYIIQLHNVTEKDLSLVGEEGLRAAALTSFNFRVTDSFLVSSIAFDDFLTAANVVEKVIEALTKVEPGNWSSAEKASAKISDVISRQTFPSLFLKPLVQSLNDLSSGRPSYLQVTPSWILGEQHIEFPMQDYRQQYIVGEENLLLAIKKAWASIFSPEAIMNRLDSNYSGPITVGLIVQKMMQAEVSGTAMSFDPTSGRKDQILVRSVFGLSGGNSLQGQFDQYRVDKSDFKISEKSLAPQENMNLLRAKPTPKNSTQLVVPISAEWRVKQKMSDGDVTDLAEIVDTLSTEFKSELEVNYTLQAGHIYINSIREIPDGSQEKPKAASKPEAEISEVKEIAESVTKKKEPKLDYQKLVEEVNNEAENPADDIGKQDELVELEPLAPVTKVETFGVEPEIVPVDDLVKIPKTFSEIALDMTDAKPAFWQNAKQFKYLQGNILEIYRSNQIVPEDVVTDKKKLTNVVQTLANELGTISHASQGHSVIVRLSNYTADSYHQMGKSIGPIAAERFVATPDLLSLEYLAIKQMKRDFGLSNLVIVLPTALDIEDLVAMKSTLTHNGFRRSTLRKLAMDMSIPAAEAIVDEIEIKEIDAAYIDVSLFGRRYLHRDSISKKSEAKVFKKLGETVNHLKKKGLQVIMDLGGNMDYLGMTLELSPTTVVLNQLPNTDHIDTMSGYAVTDKKLTKKKRGRKPKKI